MGCLEFCDAPKKTVCCLVNSLLLWLLLAFLLQRAVLGLTPQDTDWYPTDDALTWSFGSLVIVALVCLLVSVAWKLRQERRCARYSQIPYPPKP
jgi:uncharacterized membrane protein YdbT with pleckstrin-like domain